MATHGRIGSIAAGFSLITLAACGGGGSGGPGSPDPNPVAGLSSTPPAMLELDQEASCDAFRDYISDSIVDLVLNVGIVACPGCVVETAGGDSLQAAADTDSTSFDAFTGTNNQEAGVDELDQIETDASGNFYLIDGNHLVVANGLPPADLREISNLDLDQEGHAEGLLLDEENARLVVVMSDFSFFGPASLSILPPSEPRIRIVFVDVSDPANPVIDNSLSIEGFRIAARRIGDRVHVVSHATPTIPIGIFDDDRLVELRDRLVAAISDEDEQQEQDIEREIETVVESLVALTDIEDILPDIVLHDVNGDVAVRAPNCADVALPDVTMPLALTSITSVDSDGRNAAALTIANNSWNVYASEQNIYLTQTSGGWWFTDLQRQETAVYKIRVGEAEPTYAGLGVVEGWVGSPFQLSEHEGNLRIVSNRWEFDPEADIWQRDNNLYVLSDDGAGTLGIIGSVTGFGEEETIFSARFIGDRGFVVTFRQIDPLFTFDLSDPFNPQLVGEVEIEGVSTYIHLLDQNHLLTIGFDGTANGLNGDFALQIFDVQNMASPQLIHKHVPEFDADGFAWTSATWDHLAFNYFAEAGTLTVPLQYWASRRDDHFSGFIAFSVDTALGFAELGRLDHSDLARKTYCVDPAIVAPNVCDDGRYLESASPRRSVSALFGDQSFIYTLSNVGMKVSPSLDFENPVAVLELPYRNGYPWILPAE